MNIATNFSNDISRKGLTRIRVFKWWPCLDPDSQRGYAILFFQVLYVLGLLLVGKHRKQVQRQLAELQLIPKLSNLFDCFIWRSNGGRQRTRLPNHHSNCECSPEIALKIQFLRLIHSFCDHNEYKHLLMSRCEWDEVKRIPPSPAPAVLRLEECDGGQIVAEPVIPPPNPQLMCRGSAGLLTKVKSNSNYDAIFYCSVLK